MTRMKLLPVNPRDDSYICETCHKTICVFYGIVEEKDPDGTNVGNSYHCTDCMNVLARMADSLGALEGPHGPIKLNDAGDVR